MRLRCISDAMGTTDLIIFTKNGSRMNYIFTPLPFLLKALMSYFSVRAAAYSTGSNLLPLSFNSCDDPLNGGTGNGSFFIPNKA
jgi:hypothetical protein